jgi:hypothetical protein
MRRCGLFLVLNVILSVVALTQSLNLSKGRKEPLNLSREEEKDTYEIYSTVLRVSEPNATSWMIVEETRAFDLCLKAADDQATTYRDVMRDYKVKNTKSLALDRKFDLPDYTFITPIEWTRSTRNRMFAVFSAVGFNPDRTRAIVCYWAKSSGFCAVFVKQRTWRIDRDWHGGACGWAA